MSVEMGYKITKEMCLDFYGATTKERVEELLAKNGLNNNKEKTKFLEQIMGVQKSFNIKPHDNIDNDQLEYDIRLAKFLEGSWRTL